MDYLPQHLSLGEHQYAVIDRLRVSELPISWPLIELVSPMLMPQAHLYPWLLPLHELPSGEWQSLMKDLAVDVKGILAPECILLLSSSYSVQEVHSALVSALYYQDETGTGRILRYYDSRVLFHLQWMLTPSQITNYLPVKKIPLWTLWLEGKWQTLNFASEQTACVNGGNSRLPMSQLQRCGQINDVLAQLPAEENMSTRQSISRKIDFLLVQAIECQLSTREDQNAFALHGLNLPDKFWLAPKMKIFLEKARQAPEYFLDETSSWNERVWLDMICT
ncbi:DUF4123 domain-containing protein [Citrobacter farmeri]|uniref:DUF4123 domain-containing protein n=1 Tax=Citrobacter farmeri TaxID=67824 RepID=UPI00189A621B|nr:DUF4123 domain-containing protein [Citrobacter farmeri]EKU0079035.1 DUF4123 domain-containing protein [Citrobacter farmeri]EKU0082700.1 DUF4123 domain-containing protein [Citrobacter farmeri]MDB2170660.1 DUF4123 domain-containing protein [Citrobacter farmeri]MDZ7529603.1 DUF4123 domain-containing protein [Citrobacter farmeri]HCD1998961.1 DUF4123 domain-containing protein [Citrobacter farmeri]